MPWRKQKEELKEKKKKLKKKKKEFDHSFSDELIKNFKEKTNCPVIVNTSFNVRGEPIVNTPEDAFNCFIGTELDVLVIGNCFLIKEKQKNLLKEFDSRDSGYQYHVKIFRIDYEVLK